jgi:hypothetical protein
VSWVLVWAIFMTVSAFSSALCVVVVLRARMRLLEAAHRAADELDDWDPHPSTVLGGASPGGAVRFEIHKAIGDSPFGEDCPVCRRGTTP